MNAAWQNIWTGLTTASALDQANLALGLLGVGLMIRRTLWAFPVGMLAVSVQGVLFYRSHFPADALVQAFFFGTLAWGWWHWVKHKGAAPELPVTSLTAGGRLATLAIAVVATAAWALFVAPRIQSVMPWRDAFIAMFSVAAQVLQVRKKVENWVLWTAVNIVAVVSYWNATLAFTALLYLIYLVLGLTGWRVWWRTMTRADLRPARSESAP